MDRDSVLSQGAGDMVANVPVTMWALITLVPQSLLQASAPRWASQLSLLETGAGVWS